MAHLLGVLAVVSFLWCFQLKTRRNIIAVNLTSRLLYILQYLCLGALEGAVLDFMGLLSSVVAQQKEKPFVSNYLIPIVVGINLCLLGAGIALYENVFSIFAILGIIFEVTALWLTQEKNIRILSLVAAPCWLIYNITNGAYGSVVGNVLVMVSIGIAMLRLDLPRKDEDERKEQRMEAERIGGYRIRELTPKDHKEIAALIRYNLKNHGLDIPGTVYFDEGLDYLSEFYSEQEGRGYYVLADGENRVIGGIGYAEFSAFPGCAELQKLYLADSVKGSGLGYELIRYIEDRMKEAGYQASYLETHSNLKAALHIYEKSGYKRIDRPETVAHGAMDHFYYKNLL